jgi:ribonuclease BN (tRNA processing enzyme)
MGFPFFRPLYVDGTVLSILSCIDNKSSAKSVLTKIMSRPFFPVQLQDKDIKARLVFKKIKREPIKIGSLTIDCIPLSHPKDGGLGFRFKEDEKTFVFLTDNELGHVHEEGCTFNMYLEFCRNADLLIHDAEYEQKEYNKIVKFSEIPWGHSVIEDVVKLGIGANVKQLGFFHLNAMRTDELVDNMVKKAKNSLKNKNMKCFAVGSGLEIVL